MSPSRAEASMLLPMLKGRQVSREAGCKAVSDSQPLAAKMEFGRNDFRAGDKNYIAELATGRGGHHKYDFVPEQAQFIYWCPLGAFPRRFSKKGASIYSNGLRIHFQRHVERNHSTGRRKIHLEHVMRGGCVQHHFSDRSQR